MKLIPKIVHAGFNIGKGITGSFIDSEWVLHYIVSGRCEFQIGSDLYKVGSGDMVLVPPRHLHVVRAFSGKRLVQYVVHFELSDPALGRGDLARAVSPSDQDRSQVQNVIRFLDQEWKRKDSGVIPSGYLTILLGTYLRNLLRSCNVYKSKDNSWSKIEGAVSHIQAHYCDSSLNLSRIAKASSLSPNYLCSVFKSGTGFSIKKYLLAFRLEKAEELLIHSRLNCSEIAEAVGFSGVHRFSRVFHENKKVAPTIYRCLNQR